MVIGGLSRRALVGRGEDSFKEQLFVMSLCAFDDAIADLKKAASCGTTGWIVNKRLLVVDGIDHTLIKWN